MDYNGQRETLKVLLGITTNRPLTRKQTWRVLAQAFALRADGTEMDFTSCGFCYALHKLFYNNFITESTMFEMKVTIDKALNDSFRSATLFNYNTEGAEQRAIIATLFAESGL